MKVISIGFYIQQVSGNNGGRNLLGGGGESHSLPTSAIIHKLSEKKSIDVRKGPQKSCLGFSLCYRTTNAFFVTFDPGLPQKLPLLSLNRMHLTSIDNIETSPILFASSDRPLSHLTRSSCLIISSFRLSYPSSPKSSSSSRQVRSRLLPSRHST